MVGASDECADQPWRDFARLTERNREKTVLRRVPQRLYRGNRHYTACMSSGISVDEFQALEQKVLRAVEIVKREREARSAAESEVASLREQLAAQSAQAKSDLQAAEARIQAAEREKQSAESQIASLTKDREAVRQRVDKMLQQMDELL